jgi:hypothetical protein
MIKIYSPYCPKTEMVASGSKWIQRNKDKNIIWTKKVLSVCSNKIILYFNILLLFEISHFSLNSFLIQYKISEILSEVLKSTFYYSTLPVLGRLPWASRCLSAFSRRYKPLQSVTKSQQISNLKKKFCGAKGNATVPKTELARAARVRHYLE